MLIKVPKMEDLLPKPVTPGIYSAVVSNTEVKTTQKGDPMVACTYTITSQGPNPMEKTQNRKLFDNLTITENSLWKVASVVKELTSNDLPEGDVDATQLASMVASSILNKPAVIRVGIETYMGKEKNTIEEIKSKA